MKSIGIKKDLPITHSIYYLLTPKFLRGLPIIFWGSFSILAFGIATFLVRQFGENVSLETIAAFCSLFTLIPMSHIQDYRRFYILIEDYIDLYKLDSNNSEILWSMLNKIFAIKNPTMWVVSITANIICTVILMYLGLPFRSTLVNLLAIIAFEIIVFFGGQSAYTTLADLTLLKKFASLSPRMDFLATFPLKLKEFSTAYYLNSSLHILLIYVMLLVMVFRGPYSISLVLTLLLVVIALLPTTYIGYFFYQVHKIMVVIKQRNIEIIEDKIRNHWKNNFDQGIDKEKIECLEKLLEIRDKIQQMSEWPWDITGSVGFFVSTGISVTQTVLAIMSIM